MKLKILFYFALALTVISCQFNETMVMNADGSGTMSVEVNLNEMMAFSGAMMDTAQVKVDTTVYVKDFLEEKKDSIAKLSKTEQKKLKKLENFIIGVKMDSEAGEMNYNISTNFKKVSEANDIMNGLEQATNMAPNDDAQTGKVSTDEDTPEIIGVDYTFKDGVFKRDAYIKDKELHKKQVDSLKEAAAFMGSSNYTLHYTFPKKIKETSNPEATFSADKKTMTVKKPFIEYFKNPDVLDLEVELEN
ncbi:hypothetical protein [Aequorivita marina]|uniref:hypothetical protein n=1 Tax=Aequorivita marina TaxID=3073654 RepID=UPI002875E45B|nr:hypothetical protein [Aequorivita sp. S2608]MDS1297135.1 hypothetical protein [Aequorivita sp. S2608]